jgi:hypothetical protein
VAAAIVIVLIVLIGAGVALKLTADRQAEEAAAETQRLEMAAAKADAARVLASVEKCQSAVSVGVTLNDLSSLAATARQDVTTFERSSAAALMPGFTKAVAQATQAYLDSSRSWFEDNQRAKKEWDVAYDRWTKTYRGTSPDLEDFQDDSKYQKLWSDADGYIQAARSAFALETDVGTEP